MCDYNLGKILDLMDTNDMWKDTMIIVGTDHGFLLAEHGYWGKNKMPYYNEVANTPLFVWDPRSAVKNESRNSIVQMIDWAPTILEYFNQEIPQETQGKSLKTVISDDRPIREYAIFGVFSGHVNITNGKHAYMRAPLPEKKEDIYNYTLVPQRMTARFTVKEMQNIVLHPPFSFTKGVSVLKIKGKDIYGVGEFGNLLFDLIDDPWQVYPIEDTDIENLLIEKLIQKMCETDSPLEQFDRLGISCYRRPLKIPILR